MKVERVAETVGCPVKCQRAVQPFRQVSLDDSFRRLFPSPLFSGVKSSINFQWIFQFGGLWHLQADLLSPFWRVGAKKSENPRRKGFVARLDFNYCKNSLLCLSIPPSFPAPQEPF
jgi:hypothetical protein